MTSLREIEEAISRLPTESKRELLRDLPELCADVFPPDGWDAILADERPRPALGKLVDELDASYRAKPEKFPVLNEDSLADPK